MFEYSYERIEVSFSGWEFFGSAVRETDDYKRVIQKKAQEGWRFVTWIPVKQKAEGIITAIDLVFEKKVTNTN